MVAAPRVQHAFGNGDGAEPGHVGTTDRARSRRRGDWRFLRVACDPNGAQPENGAADQTAVPFRKRRRHAAAAGNGMRARLLFGGDHTPEPGCGERARPHAPDAHDRRGALVAAGPMAQPGSQLAKASKSRKVRVGGRPGATGSPGNVWAGDVVLVGVRNPSRRSRYLLSVGLGRYLFVISPLFNDRLAFLTVATD